MLSDTKKWHVLGLIGLFALGMATTVIVGALVSDQASAHDGDSRAIDTSNDVCPDSIPGDAGAPTITGVGATIHPNNSLIFEFTVDVDRSAQVWVEYESADGATGPFTTAVTGATPIQDIQVMRLRPEQDYCYQVFATEGGLVSNSVSGSLTSGPLPLELQDFVTERISGQQTYDLTLMNHHNEDNTGGAVVIDEDAQVVWYYLEPEGKGMSPMDVKPNHNLVYQQLYPGRAMIEIQPDGTEVDRIFDDSCGPDGHRRIHHELHLRRGNEDVVYTMGKENRLIDFDGVERMVTGDMIVIWDQVSGSVTPVFNLFDVLDPTVDRTPSSDLEGWPGCDWNDISIDWTHSNSLWVDDSQVLMSVRHLDQVLAISPDFSGLIWRLGGIGSDFTFPDAADKFYHQHAAKTLPNGNILLFDNGNTRPDEEGGAYSRALELALDMDTMTARKVWEYRPSPDQFHPWVGNVTRLTNGNTVVLFGGRLPSAPDRPFVLVEANPEGEAISVIQMFDPGAVSIYRAYPLDSINGESKINTCTVILEQNYAEGTLTIDLTLGSSVPATVDLWAISRGNITPLLIGVQLPATEPPLVHTFSHTIGSLGVIGLLATMNTSEVGITCSDFQTANTGKAQ